MRLWPILLLLLFSCSSTTHRYPLAICAMFKNEAPWLKEWLLYHHKVLGVDRFYLYNNDSTDEFAEVLQPFIDKGIVELIDWSSHDPKNGLMGPCMDAPWSAAQLGAYNDCLKHRAFGIARWVAMIDVDEFIVPANEVHALYAQLRSAERKNVGTLRLHWRVFGTSDVQRLEEGEFLVEKLVWRARNDHPWNKHVKSIHRPEMVAFCAVHEAVELRPKARRKTIPLSTVSLHHYWTRTEQACLEKRKKAKSLQPEFFEALHQVQDETIFQYLPRLKRAAQL